MEKKYISIFLSLFLLSSCQRAMTYQEGSPLTIDDGYFGCIFDKDTQTSKAFDCENLGQASLKATPSVTAELMPVSQTDISRVYLVFKENGTDLNIPKYEMDSLTDFNDDWFNIEVFFLDQENIYIWDRSGHEGSVNTFAFYDGTEWNELDLVGAVINNLSAEYQSAARSGAFGIIDVLISSENVQTQIRIGEGYGDTVHYVQFFDRKNLDFKSIEEKQRPDPAVYDFYNF